MAVVMVIIHIAVLLHQIYTSVALPKAYHHFKDVKIELRQISCLDSGQCLPEELRNLSVPADAVNCTDGVCSCSSCFTVTGGTCTLRQCWRFENGSCVDGRTRSQLRHFSPCSCPALALQTSTLAEMTSQLDNCCCQF